MSLENPFVALDIDAPSYQNDGQVRKRKKDKKKNKHHDDSDDEDAGVADTVEFITPSGEVFELRAAPASSQNKVRPIFHVTRYLQAHALLCCLYLCISCPASL